MKRHLFNFPDSQFYCWRTNLNSYWHTLFARNKNPETHTMQGHMEKAIFADYGHYQHQRQRLVRLTRTLTLALPNHSQCYQHRCPSITEFCWQLFINSKEKYFVKNSELLWFETRFWTVFECKGCKILRPECGES